MRKNLTQIGSFCLFSLLLSSCSNINFFKQKQSPQSIIKQAPIAANWQAPLPYDGKVEKLGEFWQQFNDDLLLQLIQSAQQVSPNIADAKARIAQARANRISQVAYTRPSLDGTFSSTRAKQQPELDSSGANNGAPSGAGGNVSGGSFGGGFGSGATTNTQIGLQSVWELDLFNANKVLVESAQKTEAAANSNWHEARVAVAAELATSYLNYRFCQSQQAILARDLKSRQETARVTAISIKAGFTPSASQFLADASVTDATQQLNAQQTICDNYIKELVALTDEKEPELREKLAKQTFNTNDPKTFYAINELPAQVIAQRPDLINAEAELIAAAASVQRNQAARLPKVTLNGSIGWMWLSGVGFSGNGNVWSLGPLSITLPIFDSGKRKAELDSAEAQYEASAVNYRNKIRVAVKEVEGALLSLHSSELRHADLQKALLGYDASFKATDAKVRAGFANLLELEESRRLALQTEINIANVLQSRMNAWVTLYRAAGGDWQKEAINEAVNDTGTTKVIDDKSK
jgi:outer membrane protein, multidrug efflux system